jgi:signal transduction histidine kinase
MRAAMADIRGILFNLTADTTEDDEDEAPTDRVRACVDDVAGRWKLDTSLVIDGDLLGVPSSLLSVGQVVIHEALTNAAKHAGDAGAEVSLRVDPHGLIVAITDHGSGLSDSPRRFGMRMMERRVQECGGNLDISSTPSGTRVTASFPREEW